MECVRSRSTGSIVEQELLLAKMVDDFVSHAWGRGKPATRGTGNSFKMNGFLGSGIHGLEEKVEQELLLAQLVDEYVLRASKCQDGTGSARVPAQPRCSEKPSRSTQRLRRSVPDLRHQRSGHRFPEALAKEDHWSLPDRSVLHARHANIGRECRGDLAHLGQESRPLSAPPGSRIHSLLPRQRRRTDAQRFRSLKGPSPEATAPSSSGGAGSSKPPRKKLMATGDRSNIWYGVFQRLCQEGEVDREQLLRALELGGVEAPVQEWVDEALEKNTRYATLDFDEFCRFVEVYLELQNGGMAEMFRKFDHDDSSTIDSSELSQLLSMLGIKPMKHVVAEILREVDEDGSGELDFEEFQEVMKLLQTREGFTKTEFYRISKVFREHDVDHSKTLSAVGLNSAISSLGYALSQQDIASIVGKVNVEGGDLTERLVLKCLRRARELELDRVVSSLPRHLSTARSHELNLHSMLQRREASPAANVDTACLTDILQLLGYIPNDEVVFEVATDIGLSIPGDMDIDEIWKFLEAYREREGFSVADTKEIEIAFDQYDHKRKRVIDPLDVDAALLHMGYTADGKLHDVVQTIVAQVNLGEAEVTFFRFKQIVRRFREWEITRAQRLFDKLLPSSHDGSLLAWDIATAALRVFVCTPEDVATEDEADSARGKDFDKMIFVKVALQRRESFQSFVREHAGYTPGEVACLRKRFREFDKGDNGRIGYKDLRKLCLTMFPSLATSKKMRPALLDALQESSDDGAGLNLSFDGFLRLMRLQDDTCVDARIAKEQKVISESAFKRHEINDFREIFVQADEQLHGSLSFEQISELLSSQVALGAKRLYELQSFFNTIVPDKIERPESKEADFPDFLKLMEKLLNADFANILSDAVQPVLSRSAGQSALL